MPTRTAITLFALASIAVLLATLLRATPPARPAPIQFIALAPGLRVAPAQGIVEFDGSVAVDAHHPDTPDIYLELIVTAPDSREHESLVVTAVRPSLIHAALLAAGFKPGAPAQFSWNGNTLTRSPPTGDTLRLTLRWTDPAGERRTARPEDWIRAAPNAPTFRPEAWRFTGSRLVDRRVRIDPLAEPRTQTVYDADGTGVIIALTTFGSEIVAPSVVLSHEAAVDPPAYLARNHEIPSVETPVTVRLERPTAAPRAP